MYDGSFLSVATRKAFLSLQEANQSDTEGEPLFIIS